MITDASGQPVNLERALLLSPNSVDKGAGGDGGSADDGGGAWLHGVVQPAAGPMNKASGRRIEARFGPPVSSRVEYGGEAGSWGRKKAGAAGRAG